MSQTIRPDPRPIVPSPPVDDIKARTPHPRRRAVILAVIAVVVVGVLALGVMPRVARQRRLTAGVAAATSALPTVSVVRVAPATGNATVLLPGTLQPLLTTAIYARTAGYIRRTVVDIGARVRAGDLLAEIDAPDLDQQVSQSRGFVATNRAALQLAQTQLTRWRSLAADGASTLDELDTKVAAFNMAAANLHAAEADLRRLTEFQGYKRVVAPFSGVVTQRNVDPGALVGVAGGASAALTAGSGSPAGSLFQIARVDTLRVYLSVPEEYSTSLRVGSTAVVTVPQLPGDSLRGRVTRTARSLDPVARTLLTEVDVANETGVYIPGMYAQAVLRVDQTVAPLNVPATALVIRDGPPQVVTLRPDATVHYQPVRIGRDHGAWVEVTGGLANGATVVVNPPEDLRDGARVRVVRTDASGDSAVTARP